MTKRRRGEERAIERSDKETEEGEKEENGNREGDGDRVKRWGREGMNLLSLIPW